MSLSPEILQRKKEFKERVQVLQSAFGLEFNSLSEALVKLREEEFKDVPLHMDWESYDERTGRWKMVWGDPLKDIHFCEYLGTRIMIGRPQKGLIQTIKLSK